VSAESLCQPLTSEAWFHLRQGTSGQIVRA
jgi:hypothetical protein